MKTSTVCVHLDDIAGCQPLADSAKGQALPRVIASAGTVLIYLCLCFGPIGCATTIPPDKLSIEGLEKVGVFVWRGQPAVEYEAGHGIIGAGLTGFAHLSDAGPAAEDRASMYQSGVYDAFKERLTQELSATLDSQVQVLDSEQYVHSDNGKVDVLATSRAQGFGGVLEATVWPGLVKEAMGGYKAHSIKTNIVFRRVDDAQILWKDSLTYSAPIQPGDPDQQWRTLAGTAADAAVRSYNNAP